MTGQLQNMEQKQPQPNASSTGMPLMNNMSPDMQWMVQTPTIPSIDDMNPAQKILM
jgi:hypothetical protein